ncbi:MAG: hypothetical protein IKP40_01220 [Clostridia bacterium]|nr:hypothetical protein [Clostridia bacterium]
MAHFYEREFVEIRREKAVMEIVGVMKSSVELEDVQQYIRKTISSAKREIVWSIILVIFVWLLAAVIPVGELFLTNNPHPHLSGGSLLITGIFALVAAFCTYLVFARTIPRARQYLKSADPDSPEQLLSAAPDAVVWKQNKQWELCHAHDLVPLESVLKGRPVFLKSFQPSDATGRALREIEIKQLLEYGLALLQQREKELKSALNTSLLVYFNIEKLGGGVYGLSAGQALAKAVPASLMEGVTVSSGDSAATLKGSASEYVIGLTGDAAALDKIESALKNSTELTSLLSPSGIRREAADEPLVPDGIVQGGLLVPPSGHSPSFCAAGMKEGWKQQPAG